MPIINWIEYLTPLDTSQQIANMHTIFNIITTLILLPFGTYLAKVSEKLLPEKSEKNGVTEEKEFKRGSFNLGAIAVQTDILAQEIRRMIILASENALKSFETIINSDYSQFGKITQAEEEIDLLNKEISQYISKILVHNNSGQNVADIEEYFLITGNAERIGDHALNIGGYIKAIKEKSITFSNGAIEELTQMQEIVKNATDKILIEPQDVSNWLFEIEKTEQKIDDMTKEYREKHLQRMRKGECSDEACILYSELLTDFERIGDHILNIGQAYSKIYSRK